MRIYSELAAILEKLRVPLTMEIRQIREQAFKQDWQCFVLLQPLLLLLLALKNYTLPTL